MRIDFLNPEFHPGMNTTVRRGVKTVEWDPLFLHRTGDPAPTATGFLQSVLIKRMKDVTSEDLVHEHDQLCRTPDGLWTTLERAYGHEFHPSAIVTIINFWIPT